MLSKKGLVVEIFSAALVLNLGIAPEVALGKSASVNDLTTSTDSIVEEPIQLNPESTRAEVIAQARHVATETGETASEVLSQQLAEAGTSAIEAVRDSDAMLRSGGQKEKSLIMGDAKHKGDVFYAPAITLGYERGHNGLYYDTNTIIEVPGLNRYSHAISTSKARVPKGMHLWYMDVSQAGCNKAAGITYHFMLNKPYNTLFASNKVVYSDKCNCSQLVQATYKVGPGIDLDRNGGPGVYLVNILNSSWIITCYIYDGQYIQRLYTIYVAAMTLLLVLPLASCGVDSNVTAVPQNKLHLADDYILAARFSPQLHDIGRGAAEGYMLLTREDGVADIVNVGYMDNGQLIWSDEGLFFDGMTVEYHLDDKRLKSYPRGADGEFETSRFPGTKESRYVSIYNVGVLLDGFANKIVTGIGKQLRHWEVPGLLTSIAKCDDGVVAVAQSRELNSVTCSILRNPNNSTVLLKLYPKPQDLTASVLGKVESDEFYEYSQYMEQTPYVNEFMYTSAARKPVDYSNEGTQILREWNIYDGSYREFPLVLEDGKPAHVKGNDIETFDGGLGLDRKTCYWVSWKDGEFRSVDLTTRVVEEVSTLKSSQFDGNMRCIVTGNFLFVLDEFPRSDRLRLSHYNIKTGEKTDYFDTKDILKVNKNRTFRNELRGIAINPSWLKKHTLPQDWAL